MIIIICVLSAFPRSCLRIEHGACGVYRAKLKEKAGNKLLAVDGFRETRHSFREFSPFGQSARLFISSISSRSTGREGLSTMLLPCPLARVSCCLMVLMWNT